MAATAISAWLESLMHIFRSRMNDGHRGVRVIQQQSHGQAYDTAAADHHSPGHR